MTVRKDAGTGNKKLPLAFWNQDAYNIAIHKIRQQRHLQLDVKFRRGGETFTGNMVRAYTERSPVVGGDVFTESRLDDDGSLYEPFFYDNSMLEIEMPGKSGGQDDDIESIALYWFQPEKWFDSIKATLDLERFSLHDVPSKGTGTVSFELRFDPTFTISGFYPSFMNILGLELTQGDETSTDEAGFDVKGDGWARLDYHMDEFFSRWNKNFSRPYAVGNTFNIYGTVTLEPPPGFFETSTSDTVDTEFVIKTYSGRVSHHDGNPYLQVPSTEPIEEVYYRFSRSVTVTPKMLL